METAITSKIEIQLKEELKENGIPTYSANSKELNRFFCTNDAFFSNLDEADVVSAIVDEYNQLSAMDNIQEMKGAVVSMLNDEAFMESLLGHFNLSFFDLLKIMCHNYSELFTTAFIKKVQGIIAGKKYGKTKRKL